MTSLGLSGNHRQSSSCKPEEMGRPESHSWDLLSASQATGARDWQGQCKGDPDELFAVVWPRWPQSQATPTLMGCLKELRISYQQDPRKICWWLWPGRGITIMKHPECSLWQGGPPWEEEVSKDFPGPCLARGKDLLPTISLSILSVSATGKTAEQSGWVSQA